MGILSTTSCFAPRVYDDVQSIAKLAKENDVCHIINSAYGLQCTRVASDISEACKVGRVDIIISSTDKNFLVPVGGSILYSPQKPKNGIIEKVNKFYPGRASAAPIMDLFITFLQMGDTKLKQMIKERKENFAFLL